MPGRNEPCPCGSGKKYKRCCGEVSSASRGALRQQPALSVGQLVEVGMRFHQGGQLDQAEAAYRQALKLSPRDAGVLNLLGVLAIHRHQGKQAVDWLENAVKLAPREAQYRNNLAAAQKAVGNMNGAVETLRRLVEASPSYDEAWYNLGNALEECKRLDESAQAYRKALALKPNDPDSLYGLGRVLLQQHCPDDALKCFRVVLESRPAHARTWRRVGMALSDLGRVEEAEAAFRKALEIDPVFVKAIDSLAEMYMQHGRHGDAIPLLEQAIALDPDDENAYFGLAGCKRFTPSDLPLLDKTEHYLSQTGADEEKQVELHYALGKIYDDMRLFDKAFSHYQAANSLQGKYIPFDCVRARENTDKIIKLYDDELFSRGLGGSDSENPIFIVGMPRSGTTLTEQIISSHPSVYGAGELSFWDEQVENLPKGFPNAWDVGQSRKVAEEYLGFITESAKGVVHVTDKMPGNYQNLGLIHLIFPNARIIHCRRNPIDTCLSIYFQNFAFGHAYRFDLKSLAFVYSEYRRLMAHWREVLPKDVLLEIDYEEIVQNQEEMSHRLIEFCGLEWDDKCLEFYKNERRVKTASQWQVRQPIYKTSQERWRNYEQWIGPLVELLEQE